MTADVNAPPHRPHLPTLAHPRDRPGLPARGRVGPADAGWSGRLSATGTAVRLGRPRAKPAPRRPRALGAAMEDRAAARLGRRRRRRRLQGADAARPATGGSARRPTWTAVPLPALLLALPTRRRMGRRDRQPDDAWRDARWLGTGWERRLPRPDGRPREAEWATRERLHGGNPAVPAPDRVPAADAAHRTQLEGTCRHSVVQSRPATWIALRRSSPTTSSSGVRWSTRPTRGSIR